jgi:lipopolysaccharide transport system permease protein
MVFAGMLPWTFFSTGLAEASSSLISNVQLRDLDRTDGMVSFPARMADGLLAVLCATRFPSHGPSLWITALNVKYRDFRYIILFIVQFGLYVSPVGFSSGVVLLYSLNPMVGVIDGFRWKNGKQLRRPASPT